MLQLIQFMQTTLVHLTSFGGKLLVRLCLISSTSTASKHCEKSRVAPCFHAVKKASATAAWISRPLLPLQPISLGIMWRKGSIIVQLSHMDEKQRQRMLNAVIGRRPLKPLALSLLLWSTISLSLALAKPLAREWKPTGGRFGLAIHKFPAMARPTADACQELAATAWQGCTFFARWWHIVWCFVHTLTFDDGVIFFFAPLKFPGCPISKFAAHKNTRFMQVCNRLIITAPWQ